MAHGRDPQNDTTESEVRQLLHQPNWLHFRDVSVLSFARWYKPAPSPSWGSFWTFEGTNNVWCSGEYRAVQKYKMISSRRWISALALIIPANDQEVSTILYDAWAPSWVDMSVNKLSGATLAGTPFPVPGTMEYRDTVNFKFTVIPLLCKNQI